MTKGFIFSLLLHIFLLYVLFIYLPRIISSDRVVEVSVDIIAFEKILPDIVPEKPKPIKEVPVEPKEDKPKEDNKIREEKKIVEKPKPVIPKSAPKKKAPPKKPEPVKAEIADKKEEQQKKYVEERSVNENKVDSLLEELKRLQQEEMANDNLNGSGGLSDNEVAVVRQQVRACWHSNVGKLFAHEDLQGIEVKVYVALDKEGYVKDVRHLEDYDKYLSLDNVLYRQLVDSAIESFLSCKRIYNLPAEKYDSWKEFEFTFLPAEY